ncbi:MAG: hypothetical protein Q8S20_19650 [Sulfuritalea sp.]|nr:hypothetical protein [Sulfuritalea sp.]
MNKTIVVACVLSMASMVVHADANPLSSLLGGLGKLGNAIEQSGGQAASKGATNGDEIMRQLASQDLSPYCNPSFTEKNIKATADKFRMGQYAMVGPEAFLIAQRVASCALKGTSITGSNEKNIVGQLLALSSIANHKAGVDSPETTIRAQNALTLLRLDAEGNKDLIAQVETSGALPEKVRMSSINATTKMSAFDLATKYQKNTPTFVREYSGKTLQVNGIIKSIAGDANRALIVLNGIPKSRDEQGWQDVVQCQVTDAGALSDVMNIGKGGNVSVRGVYMKKQLDIGPSLYDCRIIR